MVRVPEVVNVPDAQIMTWMMTVPEVGTKYTEQKCGQRLTRETKVLTEMLETGWVGT